MIVDVENLGGEEETVAINALVVDDSTGAVVTEVSGDSAFQVGQVAPGQAIEQSLTWSGTLASGTYDIALTPANAAGFALGQTATVTVTF